VQNLKTAIPFQIRGYVLEINTVDKSKVFSPRKPGFAPRSVNKGFVMNKVALGQFFSELFGFPCQCHSTVDHHTHISSGRWTSGPLEDAVQRHSLTTPTWTTTRPRSGKRFFSPWRWGGSSTQAWMPTYVSILRIPQIIRVWRATVEWYTDRVKPKNSKKKTVPVPLCPPQIPHGLTRASAIRGQSLTTWGLVELRFLLNTLESLCTYYILVGNPEDLETWTPIEY
jgi:hypothetical protein